MKRKCIVCALCIILGMLVACDDREGSLTTEEQDNTIESGKASDSEWTPDMD